MLKELGKVPPGFFVIKEGAVILLQLPKQLDEIKDDDQFKRACFQTAQIAYEQLKGEALVHITEAWTVEGSKELDNYKGRPSEHPDRKASVILLYIGASGERSAFSANLVQMTDSNERTLEEGKWLNITQMPSEVGEIPCHSYLQ